MSDKRKHFAVINNVIEHKNYLLFVDKKYDVSVNSILTCYLTIK